MRHRPKKENFDNGAYGDIDYLERLERYCTYLENKSRKESVPKLFELEWRWHEDWSCYLFTHPNKTRKQFKADVISLLVKYGRDYLESETGWAGANEWINFIVDKMPELGYQPITPTNVNFFGSYIIEGDGEDDEQWGEVVGEDLLQEAILHNRRVREIVDGNLPL